MRGPSAEPVASVPLKDGIGLEPGPMVAQWPAARS